MLGDSGYDLLKSNVMDTTIGVGEVADLLGVSAPAVHRIAARLGLRPAETEGGHRRFSLDQARAMVADKGSVPSVDGLTRVETQALAALSRHPLGFTSVRALSRVAGIAPTAASRALGSLESAQLVTRTDEDVVDAGVAKRGARWRLKTGPRWGLIASAVAAVVLPVSQPQTVSRVPRRFWHLFWNADPAKLRTDRDANYIATRMLLSTQLDAKGWALANLPPTALTAAAQNRAADTHLKAMVANALATSA